MRFWDVYNSFERYWYNIPAVVVMNSIFYPDFIQRIHISRDIKENYLYPILETISDKFPNVEIVEMEYEYVNTEPTMWRYKPLFDKDCDIVLCRDIDSIPNQDELLATNYFIRNENYLVHTLRTHTNHTTPPTIILAGLCGFRPKLIPFIQNFNFEQYYSHFKNPSWGLDQNSLIGIFISKPDWTEQHFLDSPISTKYHTVGSPLIKCKSFSQNYYPTQIKIDQSLLGIVNFLNEQTTWAGEPTDIRKERLVKLLSFDNPFISIMNECIESSVEEIRNFYL